MSEEDFVTQIIILLPQEYDLLYNSFQLQINNGSDTLTTEKLRKQLSWNYDRPIKKNSRDNNVHMAHKNRSKSGNRNRVSNQKCELCQSKRHKLENCPYVKSKDRSMYKFNYFMECGIMNTGFKK